ncbi:MAG: hypothetical protein ACXW4Q_15765 [Anaerolineales bacterium]
MGRKGVSKRKPKKSNSGSNDNSNHGSANARPGESSSSVQGLVNAKESPLNRGGANPSARSNKKDRKGK